MAPPRSWLLLADKRGDNAQVEALVASLGWPCEVKNLVVRPEWAFAKPRVRPSLDHLDLTSSDALEPPWPDLAITVGRRPSMAALWLKQQSGGRTRIVLLGKPSGGFKKFDLVIGGVEIQLPPFANVKKVGLPLMRVDAAAVAAAVREWTPHLAPLPSPLVAFLIGGPTRPFVFNDRVAARLIALARDVDREGGTPYFCTSRRTPADFIQELRTRLPESTRVFEWKPDTSQNPYRALLGRADAFVVTGDSISMMVEVARLRRPLTILPLPTGPFGKLDQARRSCARWLFAAEGGGLHELRRALGRTLFRLGLLAQTRDFHALYDWLIAHGLATAGERLPPRRRPGPVPDDAEIAAGYVRELFQAMPDGEPLRRELSGSSTPA